MAPSCGALARKPDLNLKDDVGADWGLFIVLGCVSVAAMGWGLRGLRLVEKTPAFVFLGFYLLTSVVGASAVRLWPALDKVMLLSKGIDPSRVPHVGPLMYWGVLYLPLIVVPLVVRLLASHSEPSAAHEMKPLVPASGALDLSPAIFLSLFGAIVLYSGVSIVQAGFSIWPGTLAASTGDYVRLIQQRGAIMAALSGTFFGMLYGVLPAMSFASLYMAARTRHVTWIGATLGAVSAISWLSIATLQKSIILEYLLLVGIGLLILGQIRFRTLTGWGLGLGVLLMAIQAIFSGAWTLAELIGEVTLRMALGYPYYLGLFPSPFSFYGIDWQGMLVGKHFTTPTPDYNLVVSNAMWPGLQFQGAVPASAVVSAYPEGGVAYVVIVCIAVGVALALAARVGKQAQTSPYVFAVFLALLGMAYYLTQVPLVAALWLSYGLKWGLLGVGLLAAANWLFRGIRSTTTVLAGVEKP